MDVKFASAPAETAPTVPSMRALIKKSESAEGADGTDPLAFDTQDVEIRDFVTRLRRRRKVRQLATVVFMAVAAVFGILLLAWLIGVM